MNGPMTTTEAAELYGFGKGEAARQRFVAHVESYERFRKVKVFVRTGRNRTVTDKMIRRHLPHLAHRKADELAKAIKIEVDGLKKSLDDPERFGRMLTENETFQELLDWHEQVNEVLEAIVKKVKALTDDKEQQGATRIIE